MTDLKAQYFALMARAVQIGSQLPDPDDLDVNHPGAIAKTKRLLKEFNAISQQMNDLLKRGALH